MACKKSVRDLFEVAKERNESYRKTKQRAHDEVIDALKAKTKSSWEIKSVKAKRTSKAAKQLEVQRDNACKAAYAVKKPCERVVGRKLKSPEDYNISGCADYLKKLATEKGILSSPRRRSPSPRRRSPPSPRRSRRR